MFSCRFLMVMMSVWAGCVEGPVNALTTIVSTTPSAFNTSIGYQYRRPIIAVNGDVITEVHSPSPHFKTAPLR